MTGNEGELTVISTITDTNTFRTVVLPLHADHEFVAQWLVRNFFSVYMNYDLSECQLSPLL